MISVQFRGLREMRRDLAFFVRKAVPFAMRDGLNGCAFATQREWRREMGRTFTLRNAFTERSVRVEKVSSRYERDMQARVGSVAPYMGDQEEGAVVRGRGKHKAIPGPAAAGQRPGAKRTRMVRAGNKLSAINVASHPAKGRRGNAIALAIAQRKNQPFALLNRKGGKGKGLFRVSFARSKAKTRLLWDVSRRSVRVTAEPTLQRTLNRLDLEYQRIHGTALLKQLRRYKIAGY